MSNNKAEGSTSRPRPDTSDTKPRSFYFSPVELEILMTKREGLRPSAVIGPAQNQSSPAQVQPRINHD